MQRRLRLRRKTKCKKSVSVVVELEDFLVVFWDVLVSQ